MMHVRTLSLLLLALLTNVQQVVHAQIEALDLNSGEQILVLRNGSFVTGFINSERGRYSVQTRHGSRIIIPSDKTLLICNTLDEVYWGRLSSLKSADVQGQQSLFRWCLQYKLWSLAENQLNLLQMLKLPRNQIDHLERQMKVAMDAEIRDLVRQGQQMELVSRAAPHQPIDSGNLESQNYEAKDSDVGQDFFDRLEPNFSSLPRLSQPPQRTANAKSGEPTHPIQQVSYDAPVETAISGSRKPADIPTVQHPGTVLPSRQDVQPGNPQASTYPEPARIRESEMKAAKPLRTANDSTPLTSNTASEPLGSTIGEIPRLDTRPTIFVPHDEFDPEIFNRETQQLSP